MLQGKLEQTFMFMLQHTRTYDRYLFQTPYVQKGHKFYWRTISSNINQVSSSYNVKEQSIINQKEYAQLMALMHSNKFSIQMLQSPSILHQDTNMTWFSSMSYISLLIQ